MSAPAKCRRGCGCIRPPEARSLGIDNGTGGLEQVRRARPACGAGSAEDDPSWRCPASAHGPCCRCCRLGPPLGALPPMRMSASWYRSQRSAEYKVAAHCWPRRRASSARIATGKLLIRRDRCRRLFQLCLVGDSGLKTSRARGARPASGLRVLTPLSPTKRSAVMPLSTRPHRSQLPHRAEKQLGR
jgi:hypothetical protein